MGMFGLVAHAAPRDRRQVIADAVAAAAAADVAVVVVGLTEEQETEAVDKSTLQLPGAAGRAGRGGRRGGDADRRRGQRRHAGDHAVAGSGRRGALGRAARPGGRARRRGRAARRHRTGRPAGHTFPAEDGAAPAWSVTPVDGELPYAEGTFIGYRGHLAGHAPAPAFWFGHGLGYATWRYDAAAAGPRRGVPAVSHGDQHRRPSQPRGRAGLLRAGRARPAGAPGRLAGGRGARRAGPHRWRCTPTRGCGAGGTPQERLERAERRRRPARGPRARATSAPRSR